MEISDFPIELRAAALIAASNLIVSYGLKPSSLGPIEGLSTQGQAVTPEKQIALRAVKILLAAQAEGLFTARDTKRRRRKSAS
ncbi:MAG: hypothetical protein ABSB74_04470 [Tepidisphaeraceae bacterium]